MALYRDTGVVLRVHKLGEADRIITLLTRRHGKVRAVAKGVRRTRSRFGARLEPFGHVDVQFYPGRDAGRDHAGRDPRRVRRGLVADYQRYTAASAISRPPSDLAEEGEPVLRLYLLVVGALRALSDERDPSLVLDAFLIRAMAYAGWAPALDGAPAAARPGPHAAFNVPPAARCARSAARPVPSPRAGDVALIAALLTATGRGGHAERVTRRDATRPGSGAPAVAPGAELRSLPLVERRA